MRIEMAWANYRYLTCPWSVLDVGCRGEGCHRFWCLLILYFERICNSVSDEISIKHHWIFKWFSPRRTKTSLCMMRKGLYHKWECISVRERTYVEQNRLLLDSHRGNGKPAWKPIYLFVDREKKTRNIVRNRTRIDRNLHDCRIMFLLGRGDGPFDTSVRMREKRNWRLLWFSRAKIWTLAVMLPGGIIYGRW